MILFTRMRYERPSSPSWRNDPQKLEANVPNYRTQRPRCDYAADEDTSLGAPARNASERRQVLDELLNGLWANSDIGKIERYDTATDHGWEMCVWKRDPA